MIVVDTSALVEVLFDAPLAEALIVAGRRGPGGAMASLVRKPGAEVVPATEATARRVSAAYGRRGEGVHPARLNFGGCFACALAEERGCPSLSVGGDFSRTDIGPCL